jgi:hypothetical protein
LFVGVYEGAALSPPVGVVEALLELTDADLVGMSLAMAAFLPRMQARFTLVRPHWP